MCGKSGQRREINEVLMNCRIVANQNAYDDAVRAYRGRKYTRCIQALVAEHL